MIGAWDYENVGTFALVLIVILAASIVFSECRGDS